MTWTEEHSKKFAYPRFMLEKNLWLKFRGHCVENNISIEKAVRKLIVRYMKHNNICDESVPDEPDSAYLQLKKEKHKEQYQKDKSNKHA